MQHAPVTDLLSPVVDERIERFMTLPSSYVDDDDDDNKKPSPSLYRPKRELTDERTSCMRRCDFDHSELLVASQGASLKFNVHEDVVEWLHADLGLSSSEQEALIREQERMLSHWNANHSDHESYSLDDTIDGIPLTVLQSYIDHECMESGEIHPELLRQQAIMEQILRDQNKTQDETLHRDAADTSMQDSSNDKDIKAKCSSKKGLEAPGHVELYPGKHVRIHDKDRAYASLANGDAAIFKCAGCGKCLLAAKDTKLLYCCECGTLTPTEIEGKLKDSEYLDESST